MPWTRFMDMHSGGRTKEEWKYIYIEAGEEEAKVIFYNKFGHSAGRVTCTCCGPDYSVDESPTLREATAYERGCDYDRDGDEVLEQWGGRSWTPYRTLEDYCAEKGVLVIPAAEIKPEERVGEVPVQGYVWHD